MVTDQNKNRCHKDFISTGQTWLALPTTEITITVFIIWKKGRRKCWKEQSQPIIQEEWIKRLQVEWMFYSAGRWAGSQTVFAVRPSGGVSETAGGACLCLLHWVMTVIKHLGSHLIWWMGWNSRGRLRLITVRKAAGGHASRWRWEESEFYSGSSQPPNSNKVAFVNFMDFYYSKIHKKRYTLKESKWFSHGLLTISTEIFVQY